MPAAAQDPDLALRVAKAVADLYSQATGDLLAIVARRLARGIDQPGWAERKLAETMDLRREVQIVVGALANEAPDVVEAAVRQGWVAGLGTGTAELVNEAAVDALVRETVAQVTGTHGGILRQALDVYRTVVADAAGQAVAGAQTRRQVAQRVLDGFADRGVATFVDRAGRRWALESYTEMATRTAVGRAQVAGTLARFEAAGDDLVIVSDAPQECEACRPWEGRVLSISGRTAKGTRVTGGDGQRFTVAGTVREAQSAGLHHPNCRHRLGKFVAGLTNRMTDTADPDGDTARQQQRYLERGVRRWKAREAAALDDAGRRSAAAKARAWQARLREHVDAEGLKRQPQRERLGAR